MSIHSFRKPITALEGAALLVGAVALIVIALAWRVVLPVIGLFYVLGWLS
ncbi:MAG: hypothetical protein ACAH27_05595 [Xanthobacteraceae bacterium]